MTDAERLELKTEEVYQHLIATMSHGVAHLAATGDSKRLDALRQVVGALFDRAYAVTPTPNNQKDQTIN